LSAATLPPSVGGGGKKKGIRAKKRQDRPPDKCKAGGEGRKKVGMRSKSCPAPLRGKKSDEIKGGTKAE